MNEPNGRRWNIDGLTKFFREEHVAPILERYSDRQIDFITSGLRADEINAVRNPDDYLTAAVISHMPPKKWKMYEERYEILDEAHYRLAQIEWLIDKRNYLEQELGRKPTDTEFADRIGDIENVGLRNRALYIFKYMKDRKKIRPKVLAT